MLNVIAAVCCCHRAASAFLVLPWLTMPRALSASPVSSQSCFGEARFEEGSGTISLLCS